ncbi:MAG: HAMP domain-containing histidine kinase [Deltaproteobacteria bacterium]|nr:HAMP domain-containing histidine kinase [Deltaproteobacteria bacterium]
MPTAAAMRDDTNHRSGNNVEAARGDGRSDINAVLHLDTARLWKLMNTPRPVDPHSARAALLMLLVVYAVAGVVRYDPQVGAFLGIRLTFGLYVLAGAVWVHRLDWQRTRFFQMGLTLFLAMTTAYMEAVRGYHLSDLALSALTTFVPLIFLFAAKDVLTMSAALLVGHALILQFAPPSGITASAAALVLGSATAAGAATAFVLATYRAGMMQSREWWRQACERERALRACAALGMTQGDLNWVADELARLMIATLADCRCLVLLAEASAPGWRIAAATGVESELVAALQSAPPPPALLDLAGRLVRQGTAPMQRELDSIQRHSLSRKLPAGFFGRFLVALPIVVDDAVGGAVLLTADEQRSVDPNLLELWRAMASQVGQAIGKTRLLARLQQALNAKNEFVNTMSHELRSPLNVIIGYSEMLEDGGADPQFTAGRIRASALELLLLIENTMSAARLGAGKVRVQTEEVDVGSVFSDIADVVRTLPEAATRAPIEWKADAALPRLRMDRLKLKEIIQNLVVNALKYAPGSPIRVSAFQAAGQLRLEVQDHGPGIPAEAQTRIFEMFERVEHAEGASPAGAGLGLYIVKSLVTLMGGSLDLESQVGVGSTFIIHLPLTIDGSDTSAAKTEAPSEQMAVGY